MTIVEPADATLLVERLTRFVAAFGVTVTDPTILSISSNVVVHLRPSPIVARVANVTAKRRDRPDLALAPEVLLASHLVAEGGDDLAECAIAGGPARS